MTRTERYRAALMARLARTAAYAAATPKADLRTDLPAQLKSEDRSRTHP